ncbi:hypothetical protein V1514DRAFT_340941 [Lipomyces japonicus]|uniref:uncharacterized protein n=1 Tax=Lipomyces japonicus TaxID=56871 RepID=UPI0034CD9442
MSYQSGYKSLATGESEWDRLNSLVAKDPDDFDNWESLIRATESLEGGLGRGTTLETVEKARSVFDAFLKKFPLLFGYWKRYADIEFSITGSEGSELVYERAVAGIPNSVEIWTSYCAFKMDTSPDIESVRELFESASDLVGLDFLSHTFWDKYIEFEERMERPDLVIRILERIIAIPLHQYGRYYERFTQLAPTRPVRELVSEEDYVKFKYQLDNEYSANGVSIDSKTNEDVENELRARILNFHLETFTETQKQTSVRWPFEAEIKRPYFHIKELAESELINWRKYLDFEESQADVKRIQFLYEKCLVSTALYDEFWLRYIRWLTAIGDHEEEIRNVYRRACSIHIPITRLAARINYAHFEESEGNVDLARDILDSILVELPGNIETIIARANLERRVAGWQAAVDVFKQFIESKTTDVYAEGALLAEWARTLYASTGSAQETRKLFQQYAEKYLDVRYFWINYLQFEINLPSNTEIESSRFKDISNVHDQIRTRARLPPHVVKDLSHIYMVYLLERGNQAAIKEYNKLDAEVNG